MDVSVVIPTRGNRQPLERCLDAVLRQQFDGAFEVLVCEDGDSGDAAALLAEWSARDARLAHLRQPQRGPAAARNLGIRHARAPLVAMTDDDTVPQPGWLAALCAAAADPRCAGAEGKVTPGRALEPLEEAPVNEAGGVYLTCNAVYRREALIAAGGFDERFPFAAFEDTDLAARILRQGPIAWAPEAVVVHPPRRRTWRSTVARLERLPWVAVVAGRYGYLGWPRFPTRHPRARAIWSALVALPAGRFFAAVRAMAAHPAQALVAALWALAEPWAALLHAVPALLRVDLEAAAFQLDYLNLSRERPRVGVVIVTTCRPEALARCIDSFAAADYPELKWIVVANAARPEQLQGLQNRLPGVEWIVSAENLGYTGGNNAGIERAVELGCEYFLILNDDTECIAPDFIRRLVRFLELNPRVAVAGPRVFLRRRGEVQNTVLRFPSLLRNLVDWFGFRLFPARYDRSGDQLRSVEMLNGVCVLLRAEAVRQVGAFDPRFFMYVEDADLGLRLRQAGWQLAYVPVDSVVHLQKDSGYDLYGWVSLLLRRNSVYFLFKHRRRAQAFGLAAANLLLLFGRACVAGSRSEFRRRIEFLRALWRELRGVLWTASWEPAGSWKPSNE